MSGPGPEPLEEGATDPSLSDVDVDASPTRLADFDLTADLGLHDGIRSWFGVRRAAFDFTKKVLVKVADRPFKEDPGTALRVIEEARIGMRLHHPNLVSVLDMARDGDSHFLVREWVDGAGLRAIFRTAWAAGRQPPLAAILRIGVGVARALGYLHALKIEPWAPHGIVHRAVTPSNILISEYGEVRLATLSIATPHAPRGTVTPTGAPLLPAYAAPEVLLDAGHTDARSDLFSLGALVYEGVIGPEAFDGSYTSDWYRRRDAARTQDRLGRAVLPGRLRELLQRLLAERPADRPAYAAEAKDVMRRVLREELASDGEDELRAEVAMVRGR